jgi:hypothetical protein
VPAGSAVRSGGLRDNRTVGRGEDQFSSPVLAVQGWNPIARLTGRHLRNALTASFHGGCPMSSASSRRLRCSGGLRWSSVWYRTARCPGVLPGIRRAHRPGDRATHGPSEDRQQSCSPGTNSAGRDGSSSARGRPVKISARLQAGQHSSLFASMSGYDRQTPRKRAPSLHWMN